MLLRLLACLTALLIMIACPAGTRAEPEPEPQEVRLTPQRVTLFKNGFGIVNGRATLPEQVGPVRITPLPQAKLGSLWLGWDQETRLGEITARYVDITEKKAATSIPDLLKANEGKPVKLRVDDEWLTGTLRPSDPGQLGDTLLLETEDTLAALPIASVQRVQLPLDATTQVARSSRQPVLDFNLDQIGEDPSLMVEYMASGIAWSPSYRVELVDQESARITAKAVIVNDLIDLDKVDVELVTGYPHLQYADKPSSFSPASLQQFLNSMRRNSNHDHQVGFHLQQALSNTRSPRSTAGRVDNVPLDGQTTEDLYFYPLTGVTLAKGERGYFQIFTETVPYQHVYTWDIPDAIDTDNRYRRRDDDEPDHEIVWHAISLTNTTNQPWTTAPGQTTKDSRVLGQDTLHYTPVGDSTDLRITQALAIKAEQFEYEIERAPELERLYGSNYHKITIQGELVLNNRKGKDVNVRITKQVSGQVVSAQGDPTITKLATGLRKVNPRSELVWDVPLPADANGPVKRTYRYTVYIRH